MGFAMRKKKPIQICLCPSDCRQTTPASTPTPAPTSTPSSDDNSYDADGFLWGTEVYPGQLENVKNILTDTLKTKNLKMRLNSNFFSKDGKEFSSRGCMPSLSNCHAKFDLDEVAKIFKENGWSMRPMFSHNPSDYNITDSDIDNFVNFVDWFVSKYKNDVNIKYIELINAPIAWWKGTDAQLLELTNKVYDRIKSKYPDIMVGTPGFEYHCDPADEKSVKLVEYFLDKNNGAKFDYWAFHGYPMIDFDDFISGKLFFHPPTKKAIKNKYAGVYGILEIRKKMDANGWQNRKIIDTEHIGVLPAGPSFTKDADKLEAAYLVQELLLKRILSANNKIVLSGITPMKMAPRGEKGEFLFGSLNSDGSISENVKAVALLWSKLNEYNYSTHISGEFDNENQAWVEKFKSGDKKELYIFFKPFEYKQNTPLGFDNKTINYTLNLSKQPSSVKLTLIDGTTQSITPAQSIVLKAENSPKFLEVQYE